MKPTAKGLTQANGRLEGRPVASPVFSATSKQMEVLRFIAGYQRAHNGVAPSLHEIMIGVGLRAKSRIFYMLKALEERGFIARRPNEWRAIRIITEPAIPSVDGIPLYAVAVRHGVQENSSIHTNGDTECRTR